MACTRSGRPLGLTHPRTHPSSSSTSGWQNRRRAWQSVGSAAADGFVLSENRRRGGSNDHKPHSRTSLPQFRLRIDCCRRSSGGPAADRSRIQRHVGRSPPPGGGTVGPRPAGSLTRPRRSSAAEDEARGSRELTGRRHLRRVADVRGLVEDELRSWDSFLERQQATTAAGRRGKTRERAEAAIADLHADGSQSATRWRRHATGQRHLVRAAKPRDRGS